MREAKKGSAKWRLLALVPLLLVFACSQTETANGDDLPQPPLGQGEIYYLARPNTPHRQATAFAINRSGGWLSAQHTASDCDPLRLSDGLRLARLTSMRASAESDVALLSSGPRQAVAFALSQTAPQPGEVGWAMGFADGKPRSVALRYRGPAKVLHDDGANGRREQATVWTPNEELGMDNYQPVDFAGMSGGPVLNRRGEVVGVLSGQTSQQTRILVAPHSSLKLLLANNQSTSRAMPIGDHAAALRRLRRMVAEGSLRLLYCDKLASQQERR